MRGLYAIVDPQACAERSPETVAAAVLAGGCAALQLRAKALDDASFLALARKLSRLATEAGVPFFVNDRVDIAALCGAHVHVGQSDLPLEHAARLVGPQRLVGLSTHSLEQAVDAERRGANMIGFGPLFPTASKLAPGATVGLEALEHVVKRVTVPVVAIGGVSLENAARVRDAGAPLAACISAICRVDDPRAAAEALHSLLGGLPC